jgi:hypothetical protein
MALRSVKRAKAKATTRSGAGPQQEEWYVHETPDRDELLPSRLIFSRSAVRKATFAEAKDGTLVSLSLLRNHLDIGAFRKGFLKEADDAAPDHAGDEAGARHAQGIARCA